MLKQNYQSAMSKVKAGDDFYAALQNRSNKHVSKNRLIRLAPAFIILAVAAGIGIYAIRNNSSIKNQTADNSAKSSSEGFEYTESSNRIEASYIAVVYLDGYAYEPSEWLNNSIFLTEDNDYVSEKGDKLGEVTLDLKGKVYTGTPPDFSSTYNVGTEIYAMKSVKPESAILVRWGDVYSPFYRSRRHVATIDEEIGLTLKEIFSMLSDNPEVVSVELRDEENGAWMDTFNDSGLLNRINKELPGLSLLNHGQLDNDPYASGYRIPVNLFFVDGSALHMQVYPTSDMAYTFGGYIPLSKKLTDAFQDLGEKGSPWPRFTELLPFAEEEIEYLYLKNHTNGDEITCENPAWSRSPLFQILNYYRAEETNAGGRLVMTAKMGKSEAESAVINFYETQDRQILTEIQGVYYRPVHGRFMFESLDRYLYNYTDLAR